MRPLSFWGGKSVRRRLLLSLQGLIGNALFFGGAETAISAIGAVHPEFRFEIAGRDSASRVFHPQARSKQLRFGTCRDDRSVVFEVVEDEWARTISPLFAGGDGIERKLKA